MPLSEATALGNQYDGPARSSSKTTPFHIESHDPFEDHKTLEELAAWCHCFSPLVGLAEEDPVETLLLDVTGIAPLFGGEQAMNQQIETTFLQQHLAVRIGLGETVGAAWALAHYSGACSDLFELPIKALRLPPAMVGVLNRLGLKCIGDLVPLPRDELKARFGAILLQRLNQTIGQQAEIISPIHAPSDFAAEWIFAHPVTQQRVIHEVIKQLIERLCFLLSKQASGSLQINCQLTGQDSEPVTLEVGCYRPSADVEHLWKLTEIQLERLILRDPVICISLCSSRHSRLRRQQKELFDAEPIRQEPPLVASLIDRMTGRLGRQAVVRCVLQSDPQPEKAYRYEPFVGGRSSSGASFRSRFSLLDRPLHLLDQPVALEHCTIASNGSPSRFQYDGKHQTVSRHWGPERIETGWWRQRGVRRDYYRVETEAGFRFWIFRSLQDGRWFLQGAFD